MPSHTPSMRSRPVPVPVSVPMSVPVSMSGFVSLPGSVSRPLSVPVSVSAPVSGWRKGVKQPPARDGGYLEGEQNPSNSLTPYSPTSVRSIISVLSEDDTNRATSSDREHASLAPVDSYHAPMRPTNARTGTDRGAGSSRSLKEGQPIGDLRAIFLLSTRDSAMRVDTRRQRSSTGRECSAEAVKNTLSKSDCHSERSAGGVESLRAKVTGASYSPPFSLTPTPDGCSALTSEDTRSSPRRRREERSIERESSEVYVPAPGDGDGPITPLFLDEGVRLIQRYFGVRDEGTGTRSTASHTEPQTLLRPKSKIRPEDPSSWSRVAVQGREERRECVQQHGQRQHMAGGFHFIPWHTLALSFTFSCYSPCRDLVLSLRNVISTLLMHLLT
jgi:hypothetical protein